MMRIIAFWPEATSILSLMMKRIKSFRYFLFFSLIITTCLSVRASYGPHHHKLKYLHSVFVLFLTVDLLLKSTLILTLTNASQFYIYCEYDLFWFTAIFQLLLL